METPNGWERWRGETEARLDDNERQVRALWAWKDRHEQEVDVIKQSLLQRLSVLETKVAGFAAIGAAGGATLAILVEWVLKRL